MTTANFNAAFAQSLTQAVEANRDQLVATARRVLARTSAENEAEDVVSAVFIKALTRSEQFRGESTLTTWLTTCVARQARDLARSGAHSKRAMTQATEARQTAPVRGAPATGSLKAAPVWVQSDVTPKGFPSPEKALLVKEALRRVEGVLADLPQAQRDAHQMVRRAGVSQAAAAAALGVSQPTLSRMLAKADAALTAAR